MDCNVNLPSVALDMPFCVSAPTSQSTPPVPVLHLINGEHYAGAERVQDLLARRLPEFGFQVGFACVKPGVFDAMRESRDAPLQNIAMRGRFDFTAALKAARIVRQGGYRMLHAHTVRTLMVGSVASAMARVPLVYHAHSPTSHNTAHPWRDKVGGVIERRCLGRTARVIAVSRAIAEHMIAEGGAPDRVVVVPNGVPSVETAERPTPTDCWTLGVVALFRPRKGIEALLEAMAIVRDRGLPVCLRAVGTFETPEYQAEITAYIERLQLQEHVVWTGFTRDVTAELRRMDLFVLPSLFGEGLPMVVLEAMAAGVPIVATRVSGVPEAVRDGVDGVLAEPGDAESLAGALADVIAGRHDWQRLRASALERHAEQFSDRAMAAGVADVYREVLSVLPATTRFATAGRPRRN